MNVYPLAFGLASYLANSGRKKGSLSTSGALGAWVVGYFTMANDLHLFGALMIVFYLLGSKATKYKSLVKAQLESGHPSSSTPSAGHRTFFQVVSNSFSGTIVAIFWRIFYGTDGVRHGGDFLDLKNSCPVVSTSELDRWSKVFVYAAIGHFACCLGDTLASELGILSKSRPRLVTTFRPVPPGTNGGVSLFGLTVSLLGGLIISSTSVLVLLAESPACRGEPGMADWVREVMTAGMAAGLGGSLLDSLLGATVQRTVYSAKDRKVLTTEPAQADWEDQALVVVAGWNLLTNSQINLLTSMVCALACGYVAYLS
ncbi:Predicted membrane protein [Phaffia rhodozyma]|uniref:Predicted membrane protein n=1 Tax=Phaffia rhodozyma TaxID=264483 RepID=A0A0F7SHN8_PHARH|nr:Predicted membrane protein [Phaffia rhodozyma]